MDTYKCISKKPLFQGIRIQHFIEMREIPLGFLP